MAHRPHRKTRRLVLRLFAERYLTLLLVSFAVSIAATRFLLEVSGYPQIGNSELHLAHVLWGGLIWIAGGMLPLLFVNKRTLDLSALLIGSGSGLFMDEVGKFITASNDYFFPAAAPIIYSIFLVLVLALNLVRHKKTDSSRIRLFHVLEEIEEVVEGDLSSVELNSLLEDLQTIERSEKDENILKLASFLRNLVKSQEENLISHQPDWVEKLAGRWQSALNHLFEGGKLCWMYLIWMILGLVSVVHPVASLIVAEFDIPLPWILDELLRINLGSSLYSSSLERVRLLGELVYGSVLLIAVGMGVIGRKKFAAGLAYYATLVMLVSVNILVFYYDQFSAIIFAVFQVIVLVFSAGYRKHLYRV